MIRPGDVVVALLQGAAASKYRPAVVVSSEIYHRERPDVIVGILTATLPWRIGSTDYVLEDWRAAGLRVESCFRAYLGTIEAQLVTRIGRLSPRDWAEVHQRVVQAIAPRISPM